MAGPFYQQNNGMPMPSANYQPVYTVPAYPYDNSSNQQASRPQLPNTNQNQQTAPLPVGISGRTVNSVEEIKPNEVPMDGSISLFPMHDYSAIYAKQWSTDGLINTVKYIPDTSQYSGAKAQTDINAIILERLEAIEKKLDYKPYHKPYNKNRNKPADTNTSKEESK